MWAVGHLLTPRLPQGGGSAVALSPWSHFPFLWLFWVFLCFREEGPPHCVPRATLVLGTWQAGLGADVPERPRPQSCLPPCWLELETWGSRPMS